MQQYGNNKYIGWTIHFPCNVDGVVEKLRCQASEMEKDLEDWKAELSDHRDQFYELNYFTTPQLLSLREELGQFKTSPNSTKPVKSVVMSLLQCLSREITSNLVKDEVQVVCAILQEQKLAESAFDSISHDFIAKDRGIALEEERYNRQQSGGSDGSPVR